MTFSQLDLLRKTQRPITVQMAGPRSRFVLNRCLPLCAVLFFISMPAMPMQAPATATRVLGTVTAIDGNTVTLKTDAGVEQKVTVQDATRIVETAPGQTTLSGATAIHVQELQAGDRVSARGAMNADGSSLLATSLIAMKQADVEKKRDADREDWQKHGISGVVKQVDAAAGIVIIATGAGPAPRMLAVHAMKTTAIRRYAGDSAKLSDARSASLDGVKVGDELRARGKPGASGGELDADEIVVGSFRNLAGVITAVNTSAGTITITDLATKRPYVIRCTADSQLRKLPPMAAMLLAARMKGQGTRSAGIDKSTAGKGTTTMLPGAVNDDSRSAHAARIDTSNAGEASGPGNQQQALSSAPSIQLSELRIGDAVMVVTTEGTPPVAEALPGTAMMPATTTAITLIAGVEPMLQASATASQNLLSTSWSLGSGGGGGEGAQ